MIFSYDDKFLQVIYESFDCDYKTGIFLFKILFHKNLQDHGKKDNMSHLITRV